MAHSSHGRGSMIAAAVLYTIGTGLVHAAAITVPAGLNPGDHYRLVFITTNAHEAISANISDYDSFVTAEANSNAALLALGTTWVAIGSTDTVNAFDHIGGSFTIPIYNLAGSQVATGSTDLWDGTIGAPIEYDQNGDLTSAQVWTGTSSNGQQSTFPLGAGSGLVSTYGASSQTNSAWVLSDQIGQRTPFELYGISGTLTVPGAAVPEPNTLGLVGLVVAVAGLVRSQMHPRSS